MVAGGLRLWRIRLDLRGAVLAPGVPWQADTLWGQLCWILRDLEGVGALETWLQRYREGAPPLLLSDGFPGDSLPLPLLPTADGKPLDKLLKRVPWLSRDGFLRCLETGTIPQDAQPAPGWEERFVWKNTVSRASWSSLGEEGSGGLFVLRECGVRAGAEEGAASFVTLYARVADADRPRVESWFEVFCHAGFGKRRSVGYGQVCRVRWSEETELLRSAAGANGWVTLSSFVPQPGDPTEGQWDALVKHGRFGDRVAGTPWKRSIQMLTTGSVFYGEAVKEWYGGIVDDIAVEDGGDPERKNALQYAFAFPVPLRRPSTAA